LSCLLDIDCVVLAPFAAPVTGLQLFDISEAMVGALGLARFESDFRTLGSTFDEQARWYGGEFICGDRSSFKVLADAVDTIWPNYLEHLPKIQTIGDELLTSVAIRGLHSSGLPIALAPKLTLSRYWSIETLGRPTPLAEAAECKVLHLPADKEFLAQQATQPFEAIRFRQLYTGYVRQRRRQRLFRTLVKSLVKRRRHYRPRLV
jgi:hypothetical protein